MVKKFLSGVQLGHHKGTDAMPAAIMPVPDRVTLPMLQHMGVPCKALVNVGDEVKVGQLIGDSTEFFSVPVHSSVSGKVVEVTEITTATQAQCQAVIIETDKKQQADASVQKPVIGSKQDLINAMRSAGLVGLGGAGFPTHIKYNPKNPDAVDTLVVNAAECEPYITSDNRTMLDQTHYVVDGINTLLKYYGFKQVFIGIEANKPEAIQKLTKEFASNPVIKVVALKSMYPKGAEKVIVYETCGRIIKEGQLPADAGVIVSNVATIAELAKYLDTGMPLVSRALTVDGEAIAHPMNVIAPLGTSLKDIVAFTGGYKGTPAKLLMGGPMMGIAVKDDTLPLLKNNNAILAYSEAQAKEQPESPCIRCNRCGRACPMDLMPRGLEIAYKERDVDALTDLKVNLCIECGCCSYVCPAKRPLAASHKQAKKFLRARSK